MSTFENTLASFRIGAEASTYPDGRKPKADKKADGAGKSQWTSKPYQLTWFYGMPGTSSSASLADPERLNVVSRAYLGDREAQGQLTFGEATDAEIDEHLLESEHGLNERQRLAVRRALESDISLVQGPPGTGKTETILNMVSCMLARNCTVAVVSTNKNALANITEKVEKYEDAPDTQPNRRRLHRAYAPIGNKERRREWNTAHPEGPLFTMNTDVDNKHPECRFWSGWEHDLTAREFLSKRPFITSTIHSLKKCFADGDSYQYDYLIMDEASMCTPALALIALSSARHIVLVGDVEQLPPVFQEKSASRAEDIAEEVGIALPDPASPYAMQDPTTGDGMSILASAEAVFKELGAPHTFLNEHFRCHPGIIGFCSEEVYAPRGEALEVKTHEYDHSVHVPIRIRWFEGNFLEPHRIGDGDAETSGNEDEDACDGDELTHARRMLAEYRKSGKQQIASNNHGKENRKQIEVFMREEWPLLRERLRKDPEYSVRIISPFRGQLYALYQRLEQELDPAEFEMLFPLDEQTKQQREKTGKRRLEEMRLNEEDDDTSWEQTGLTIHKSQGQEYNVVYLLPVEDGAWDWPWSQGKSLINVAVSRAKDELVVICSSCLMSEETQRGLTGTYVRPSGGAASQDMTAEEYARRDERERFVQKLVDYVRDRTDPASPRFTGDVGFPISCYDYGFHRTRLGSVFDGMPAIRSELDLEQSSAELALCEALGHVDLASRGLAVACNVPLKSCFAQRVRPHLTNTLEGAEGLPRGLDAQTKRSFIEGGDEEGESHFDFVIYERETRRIVLCVEVDGGLHRHVGAGKINESDTHKDSEEVLAYRRACDACKDAIARDLGAWVLPSNDRLDVMKDAGLEQRTFTLLRLATNGTTALETRHLAERSGATGEIGRQFLPIEKIIDIHLDARTAAGHCIDEELDLDKYAMPNPERLAQLRGLGPVEAVNADEPCPSPAEEAGEPEPQRVSLTKLLTALEEEGVLPEYVQAIPKNQRAQKINELLAKAGVIEKRGDSRFATQRGRELGITEALARNGEKRYCVYPLSCKDAILAILERGVGA